MTQSKAKKTDKTNKASNRVKKQKASKPSTKKKTIKAAEKPESNLDVLPLNGELSTIEMAQQIVKTGAIKGNEFSRMRYEIAKKIVEYDRIRSECEITHERQRETIYRLAKPFLNGHFTLAVVGKTSAGKSTFINTLIGDNLFPTGYFQTTSTITYLEKGNKPIMEASFCDGHVETVLDDISEIKTRLQELVAIDEKYRSLPIYDINLFISEGAGLDDIMEAKNGIEAKRKKTIDEDLLKDYVSNHPKESMAKSITIKYPLPEEYEGWRIIDTPGVAARGGIQDVTMELFADSDDDDHKIVDAILFLHSGMENIEDESVSNYMEEFANGLTEEAKKRLFFILTKASDINFRLHRDEVMDNAINLYSQQFGISKERFTDIDSLLERFLREIEDSITVTSKNCPPNWKQDEWVLMTTVRDRIQQQLKDDGKQPTNKSIKKVMKQWSNFGQLKSMLNSFVKEEKSVAFNSICKKIEEDYRFFIGKTQEDIDFYEGKTDLKIKENRVIDEKNRLNDALNAMKREYSPDSIEKEFDFLDDELGSIIDRVKNRELKDIPAVKKTFENLIDRAKKKENEVVANIKNRFTKYCESDIGNNSYLILRYIDFDKLANEAKNANTGPGDEDDTSKDPIGFIRKGSRLCPKKIPVYPKKYETNWEQATRDYATHVIDKGRNLIPLFKNAINKKVLAYYNLVGSAVEESIKVEEQHLDEIQRNLEGIDMDVNGLENLIANLKSRIEILENRNK